MHAVLLRSGLLGVAFSTAPVCIGCSLLLKPGTLLVCFRSVLLVEARGPAFRRGVCLVGFPPVVCTETENGN